MGQEQDALARWVLSTRAGDHIDSVQHPPPYCTPLLLLIATVHSNHTRLGHFFEMRVYVCVCCFRCCLPTPRRYGALQSPASVSFEMHCACPLVMPPPVRGATSALAARRHGQESARVSFQPFFGQQHRGVFATRAAALVATARAGICRAELQSSIHWPLMELSRHRPSCWLETGLAGRLGPPSALVRTW